MKTKRTVYSAHKAQTTENKYKGLVCKDPSLTIPDQAMSLKEMMARHARGLPVTGNALPPLYDDDETSQGIDIRKLDLQERKEYLERAKNLIADYQSGKVLTSEANAQSWQERVEKLEKAIKKDEGPSEEQNT